MNAINSVTANIAGTVNVTIIDSLQPKAKMSITAIITIVIIR